MGVLERCCTTAPMNQEHTVWNTENPNPCVQVHFLFIINYCFRVRLEPWQSREEENLNWDLAIVCTGNMAGMQFQPIRIWNMGEAGRDCLDK